MNADILVSALFMLKEVVPLFCNSNGNQTEETQRTCPAGQGSLPPCGPFAVPFVVRQGPNPERYDRTKALEAGTLFPDLDLPFHLKVNPSQLADSHLNQLRSGLCDPGTGAVSGYPSL